MNQWQIQDFLRGGGGPIRGHGHGHFLVKMCAKMKELGPIGGICLACPPPRSTNVNQYKIKRNKREGPSFWATCQIVSKYTILGI